MSKVIDVSKTHTVHDVRRAKEALIIGGQGESDAKRIIQTTFKDVFENLKSEAYKSGYEIGFEKGVSDAEKSISDEKLNIISRLNAAEEQLRSSIGSCSKLLEAIRTKHEDSVVDASTLAIDLAFSIVCKVCSDKESRELITGSIVSNAVSIYRSKNGVRIVVCKNDWLRLQESLSASSPDVRFEVDESMIEGDCIVELEDRVLEVSLRSQLEQLVSAITLASHR